LQRKISCVLLVALVTILSPAVSNCHRNSAQGEEFQTTIDPDQYTGLNDFEKLQNALNDVPSAGANVIVPSKIYQGSNLIVPSNVNIIGSEGTTFKLSDNATSPFLVIADNDKNVHVENIVFDGNKDHVIGGNVSLVYIGQGSEEISIFSNIFTNFRSKAIATDWSELNKYTRLIRVHQNIFCNGEGAAMIFFGQYTDGTFFLEDVDIYGNKLYNLTANGKIGVAFTNRPIIRDNEIVSCEAPNTGSITIRGCKDARIYHNSVLENRAIAGIYVETSICFPNKGFFTIENNRIVGQIGDGFSVANSNGVEAEMAVNKNYFNDNSGVDIEIPDIEASVCGNMVESLADLSIPADATASGNRIISSMQGHAYISARAR